MRALAFVLLSAMTAAVCGCDNTVYSVYDAKTDAVTCRRVTDQGTMEVWTEEGYVCHYDAEKRKRPNLAALPAVNETPEAH